MKWVGWVFSRVIMGEPFIMSEFKQNKIRPSRLSSEKEFSLRELLEESFVLLKKQFPSIEFYIESEKDSFKQSSIDTEKFFYLLYYVIETMIFDFQIHSEIKVHMKRSLVEGKRGAHLSLHSSAPCTLEQVNQRVFQAISSKNKLGSAGLSSCQLAHGITEQLGGKLHFEYGVNEPLVVHIYLQL
jgi:hypothetical protein